MLYLSDGVCTYSIYTCRNFLRCTHRRYWALTYCCSVEFILSFIVFCFKILGIGALFGVNVLIFLSLPDYAINQTGLQEKAEQIFKEAAVIH